MSSTGALTGGSGDVNPQALKLRSQVTTASVATAGSWLFSTASIAVPVQRLPSGSKAQVMEILGLRWDWSASHATSNLQIAAGSVALSSRSYGPNPIVFKNADPYVLYFKDFGVSNPAATVQGNETAVPQNGFNTIVTGATTVFGHSKHEYIDFTDGAGHGRLFGGDTLYLQTGVCNYVASANTYGAATNMEIIYRWKNVGFQEYVGMALGA